MDDLLSATSLGQFLSAARTRRSLSQREAADGAQVSPATISHIETGRRQISPAVLLALSELYGLSANEIYHSRDLFFSEAAA